MCGYESVIMNVQTMCRHAFVSARVCAHMRVRLCGNSSSMEGPFARGIKTIGLVLC